MNVYRRLGYATGRSDAMYLAERLSAWHDAMVAHERAGSRCDESCPHFEAQALWSEALETLGTAAYELRFLERRAADAAHRGQRLEAGA